MSRADGPFEVLEKVNDNAYKIDLPGEYDVSSTFNVADLKPYFDDDHRENLRENSLQQGEDDVPVESNARGQSQSESNAEEAQEAIQVVRKFIGEQGYYPAVPISACGNLVTIIT